MNILDQHCFMENEKIAPGRVRSEYDFLYLPIDFRKPLPLRTNGWIFSSSKAIYDLVLCIWLGPLPTGDSPSST